MKINEYKAPGLGLCMDRISSAFRRHFPNVTWDTRDPDYTIVYLFGGGELPVLDGMDLSKVILFQVNYLSSAVDTKVWLDYWKKSLLTISFHNLKEYFPNEEFSFFRTALGAEPSEFTYNPNVGRDIKVFTTGHVAETECIDKVYEACKITNNRMFHTGENFRWNFNNYKYMNYMPTLELVRHLQRTQYVAGLRLHEGFEMMCLEGAMTGAVPVIPNQSTYDFYKDFGHYIDVESDIVEQLADLFSRPYVPLSKEKVEYVRHEFSWSNVCNKLYTRISES